MLTPLVFQCQCYMTLSPMALFAAGRSARRQAGRQVQTSHYCKPCCTRLPFFKVNFGMDKPARFFGLGETRRHPQHNSRLFCICMHAKFGNGRVFSSSIRRQFFFKAKESLVCDGSVLHVECKCELSWGWIQGVGFVPRPVHGAFQECLPPFRCLPHGE